ncbi:MAG: hypothetical protein HYX34_05455 [Actinobacteria bacterium]|nr:hypothetical protein [Actinomycetota bacterium]
MAGVTIEYEGSPARASQLAQLLEDEGTKVRYRAPHETRGAGEVAAHVVMTAADGITAAVALAAVQKVIAKVKGAHVKVRDGDQEWDEWSP